MWGCLYYDIIWCPFVNAYEYLTRSPLKLSHATDKFNLTRFIMSEPDRIGPDVGPQKSVGDRLRGVKRAFFTK